MPPPRESRSTRPARRSAPARAVFPAPLRPPEPLVVRPLGDGRHELAWRWPDGAGYVALQRSGGGRPWRCVPHACDPTRGAWVSPAPPGAGPWRYRIKACLHPERCSGCAQWPAPAAPAGEDRAG